jgi:photosystem II stability/assembly factor-like uncharacterized protein
MKLLRHSRNLTRPILLLLTFLFTSFTTDNVNFDTAAKDQTIMMALLLDTSNSMDGLIDQTKSQLWKIINEVAAAKRGDGKQPNIKIALYEYGNDGLSPDEGYIRQVSGLTEDLDVLSEKLFSLSTNGGNEFCGQVIKTSLNQLSWSASNDDLKMIFIAGNEPFTQGTVSYDLACSSAKEKGVVVNTIYCGDFNDGITLNWKRGAELTGGAFMSINQDNKTVYVPTPYDDQIALLNDKLNGTYVYYGAQGEYRKQQQIEQDNNAASYGLANIAERSFCKSSHAYKNSSWDLVDAAKDDEKIIAETRADELPGEMRTMSLVQRKVYIQQKSEERTRIQGEIQSLNKKRLEYIFKNTPESSRDKMLDASMLKAIKEQGSAKNFKWEADNVSIALPASSPVVPYGQQKPNLNKSGAVDIVFKSTDGGQTWQDISEGLPENLPGDGLRRDDFFANESGLYLRAGNGIYHSKPNSSAPFWKKEIFPDEHSSIAPGKAGIFAYHWDGQFLQKINGTKAWSPVYTDFHVKEIRTVFETAGGSVFIGSESGLFKSANGGKTWKRVYAGGWVLKLVESNGVLMATSQSGILRSTDGGENWDRVLHEGGVGIAVEPIEGGFAAITANTRLMARTVRASYDGGKTWQPIDVGLPADLLTASIVQVGRYFFCGHPAGIFRSSDNGNTWELLLPSIGNKVFNLSVSGNVIYAIPTSGGC